MKKLFVLVNDIHLRWDNTELVKDTFNQVIKYCKENNLSNIIIAGDVFTSQIAQRLDTLKTWKEICKTTKNTGIFMYIIPGNHDKTLKDVNESFLDVFDSDAVDVISEADYRDVGAKIAFLPYYSQNKYVEVVENMESADILISHQGICGSINNDGSIVENGIKPKHFDKFKKVFLGHYHNTQEVTKKIIHTPSLYQGNYGENDNKGFTVVYEDLSYEIINTIFPKYITKIVDLDKATKKELQELSQIDMDNDNIRLRFKGSESKTKSIDKNYYRSLGFDVDTKNEIIEDDIEFDDEFVEYNEELIKERFNEFCEENELDKETGFEILNKIF